MRMRRKGFSEYETITTKKSSANGLFWPMTPRLDATDIKNVRPALELTHITADVSVQVGWQLADDEDTWPVSTSNSGLFATGTLAAQTAEGLAYATVFEDISSAMTKRYARFGAWIKNGSGSTLESCVVAIRLEFKKV